MTEDVERQLAILDASAQVAEVGGLLPAQADAAQAFVRHGKHLRRRGKGLEEPFETQEDGRGRLRRELLADDGADERLERIHMLARPEAARTMRAHQIAQNRIAPREQPPGSCVIDRHHFSIDVSVTCARISISPAWIGGAACAAAAASRNRRPRRR